MPEISQPLQQITIEMKEKIKNYFETISDEDFKQSLIETGFDFYKNVKYPIIKIALKNNA